MIKFDSVSKIYRGGHGEVRALDEVSVSVDQGEFVAVRGPSGCGKSTMLSLVGGLALPTSGTVSVAGFDLSAMTSAERAKFRAQTVGFVFQMFHLLPYLSIVDNVVLAAKNGDGQDLRDRAKTLLDDFGLNKRLDHRPSQLSTGERQRVAMARALLNKPKLLLADEPTGNLDPDNANALLDLLTDFHKDGGTILLVTHDDNASARAKRLIELNSGQLV